MNYFPQYPNTSRAILGALAAGKSAPVVANPISPDAELINLCARYEDLTRQWLSFFDTVEDDDKRAIAQAPLNDPIDATFNRMYALRATTVEGFKARGRAFAFFAPEHVKEFEESSYHDNRMLAALLRDLVHGEVAQ